MVYYAKSRPMSIGLCLLLIVSSIPLALSIEAQAPSEDSPSWFQPYGYRFLIEIEQEPFPMMNYPVELLLNITDRVSDPAFILDDESILLVEYTGPTSSDKAIWKRQNIDSVVASHKVPYRFYKHREFDPGSNARGTFSWILDGETTSTRYYHIYFDDVRSNKAAISQVGLDHAEIDSQYWIQRGLIFYGFNPGEQSDWRNGDEVELVGLYDGTAVTVTNITSNTHKTLFEETLEEGELIRHRIPDGIYFKIRSDKPILASVSSAFQDGGSAKTFYPSTDKNLVGKQFMLAPYHMTQWDDQKHGMMFFAIEDTEIDISEVDGTFHHNLKIQAGSFEEVKNLESGKVYNVVSTGLISIEHMAINGFNGVPSTTGSPVGTLFYSSIQGFDGEALGIFAYEDANFTIIDLETGEEIISEDINALQSKQFDSIGGRVLTIKSTGNISVLVGSTEGGREFRNLGDDIGFTGGLGGRNILTYSIGNPGPGKKDHQYPTDPFPGVIFSFYDNNSIFIDGKRNRINHDGWKGLEEGFHSIVSDYPISVMTIGRGYQEGAPHRWNDWGTYLAGRLPSPNVKVSMETLRRGMSISPHPSEGSTNDTMVHAVEPGKSTTFRINIENTGTLTDKFEFYTGGDFPPNWTIIMQTNQFILEPGEVKEFKMTVQVPSDATGQFRANISFHGRSVKYHDVNDTVYAIVVVDPVYFPDLSGEYIKYIDPGHTAVFNLTVSNLGNHHDTFLLEMVSPVPGGWSGWLSMSEVPLDMNHSETFTLSVQAPTDALAGDEILIDVRATSKSNTSKQMEHRTRTIVNQVFDYNVSANQLIAVRPGADGKINITLDNLGNGDDDFDLSVTGFRSGWTAIVPDLVSLAPYGTRTVVIGFNVPGWNETLGTWGEVPGDTILQVTIMDLGGIKKVLDVTVTVLQVFSVDLLTDEVDMTVASGEVALFRLRVKNVGNGPDTIQIASEAKVLLDKKQIILDPGQVATVNCTVPVSKDRPRVFQFKVTANSTGNASDETSLTVRTLVLRQTLTIGELSCLWIFLIALAIFSIIEVARRQRGDRY